MIGFDGPTAAGGGDDGTGVVMRITRRRDKIESFSKGRIEGLGTSDGEDSARSSIIEELRSFRRISGSRTATAAAFVGTDLVGRESN